MVGDVRDMGYLRSINEEFHTLLEEREGFFMRFDTFATLEKALLDAFGALGLTILYLAGVECGKMYYDRISHITTDEKEMLELVRKLKWERNWGDFQIEIDKERRVCKVTLKGLFETRTKINEHCPFVRGYMVGFLSKLLKRKVRFEKEACKREICELYYKIEQ
jgi:predicted hydrocarbon binding protein